MDFKFSNDAKEPASAAPAEKGRQNMLLVILLILVAAFAYLYFFTGLIKPQEAQKPAEAPAPQVVKKPLPPRDGQTAKDETANAPGKNTAAPAPPAANKVVSADKPVAGTPVVKEEPQKAAPQKTEPPKPAPAVKKTAASEKKAAAPEAKEPKTAAASKLDTKKPTLAAKQQPSAAVKKTASGQEKNKKTGEAPKAPGKSPANAAAVPAKKLSATAGKKEAVKSASAKANGPWTVVVGNYVLEDAMATDLARAKGAGLEVVVKQGGRKKTAMNRLHAGDYPTRAEAVAELDKLKHYTSDAFILEQGGKFAVYAGSYLLTTRAGSEKERLAAAGVKLTIRQAEVSIPSKSLIAGTFNDKKAADAALKKLKGLGIKATLAHP
ncbi:SPOR domain-containing protein [Geobacter sp. AOG2]|uniref:SPOR domain-containing protein n=1 Tax=Geobacter sp. AOG2 TaxID=1566347 RepID=UPI001CC37A99|nr:SPOR domain-containing protein [Geobacter sp. AOG2]GFE61630.1 SPOR domain-containing protein [Geobacter sp. AOG2]